MLITKKLSLHQILAMTWKVDLAMVAFCSVIYLFDTYLFTGFTLPIAFPALMGTAIAFFIGFNSNQAYSRWWEARIVWGGIVNDSRSWARSLVAYNQDSPFSQRMIYRHIVFLYVTVAMLRKETIDKDYLAKYLDAEELAQLNPHEHFANALLNNQAYDLDHLHKNNQLNDFAFAGLNQLLQSFCDGLGKSERINNTPFPITYTYFTQISIWLFITLITMSTSTAVGFPSILLGWLMGFVFNVIHLNGLELVNPFEKGAMAIPISSITRNIEINLLHTLKQQEVPAPLAPINGEYLL